MNLENLNVQELNTEDQKNVDGGLSLEAWSKLKGWGLSEDDWVIMIDGLILP